jgi:pimeloyl-ACP methyl ester carboxylesterase
MGFELFKKRTLPDHKPPIPPYFLKADDLFIRKHEREIFIKKIYSVSEDIPKRGSIIMAPGIATNANLFRIDDRGGVLDLSHNRSFANLLASEGFSVYLYHPGYTERAHNRYVCKHCKESIYYGGRYVIPPTLSFVELAEIEVPMLLHLVTQDAGEENISWIGYSMGGMLMYSYLSRHSAEPVKNVITIGSPITLNHIFVRVIPYTNMASRALGFEESAFLGMFSENLVPLTRLIRILPNWLLRYNLLSLLLFNPLNIYPNTIKTLLGKIVEPIPGMLEACFADIIVYSSSCGTGYTSYLANLQNLRKTNKNFLFFFGPNDVIAPPDSIYLAHEIISPDIWHNLIEVPSAGHVDLIVGKNSLEKVWLPVAEWLKRRYAG